MNIAYPLLHLIFMINILSIMISFSQTLAKLLFIGLAFLLLLASLLQKKKYSRWSLKDLHVNGFFFLLFYLIMLSLGFLYGYDKKYVIINIFLLIPLFAFIAVPRRVEAQKIYNIILFYASVSVFFSYLEIFLWESIGFIKSFVDASVLANEENHMLGSLFRDGELKAFGIFTNALQNGLFIDFSLIILAFRLLNKFNWYYAVMVCFFLPVIYWTYTRNVSLSLIAGVLLIIIINRQHHAKVLRFAWLVTIFSYLVLVVGSFIYVAQLNEVGGDSIYARVFSWGIIGYEYFLTKLGSFHVLMGFALTQYTGETSPEVNYWAIDNSVLMIYLSSGLLGVFLYFSWLHLVVKLLYAKIRNCESDDINNIKTLIVVIFVYIISGAMNANILNIHFLLPVLLLISSYFRLYKRTQMKRINE